MADPRQERTPGHSWQENELHEIFLPIIGSQAAFLFCSMTRHSYGADVRASSRMLAEYAYMSKDRVQRCLRVMIAIGMIEAHGGGPRAAASYTLIDLKGLAIDLGGEYVRHLASFKLPDPVVRKLRQIVHLEVEKGQRRSGAMCARLETANLAQQTTRSGATDDQIWRKTPSALNTQEELQGIQARGRDLLRAREATAGEKPPRPPQQAKAEPQRQKPEPSPQPRVEPPDESLGGIAKLVVCAHPRSKLRNLQPAEVEPADRDAVLKAMGDETRLVPLLSARDALRMIHERTTLLAEKIPRSEWMFCSNPEKFYRNHDYRMEPEDFTTRGGRENGVNQINRGAAVGRVQRSQSAWDRAAARRGLSGIEPAVQADASEVSSPRVR